MKNKYGVFCHYKEEGAFWVRIFGYGFLCINTKIHPVMTFSERQGIRKYLYVGKYKFRLLKP